jgi:hypothetical protein
MSSKYSQITGIDGAAKTLAQGSLGAIPASAAYALIQAEAQNVRWRDDGVAPTASVGNLLLVGSSMVYEKKLSAIQFISAVAGAIVNVNFYTG